MYPRKFCVTACFICLFVAASATAGNHTLTLPTAPLSNDTRKTSSLTSGQVAFTKNMGQWPDSILFRASAAEATMWFTRDGIYYQYVRTVEGAEPTDMTEVARVKGNPDRFSYGKDSVEMTMFKAEFVGASSAVEVVGLNELEYKCNYFIGNEPSRWHTDVPNYAGFTLKGLYSGVDVSFRGNNGKMESKIVSSTTAALAQVQVYYRGAQSVEVQADGTVIVTTVLGERRLCGVLPAESNAETFRRPDTDAFSPTNVSLFYSTYLGGAGTDNCRAIAVDSFGNVYVAGLTTSVNFPTQFPYQTDPGDGAADIFITKLSESGNSLVYSSYLGGSSNERANGLAVDGSGNGYVTGYTYSSDFPTHIPFQTDQGDQDAFVTKLSATGSSLVYSSYLGGSSIDIGWGIAVGNTGHAYVTGETFSTNFPSQSPYQTDPGDGDYDVFVTKVSELGTGLVYSGYLGGSGADRGYGIAVDSTGNAYVTGATGSTNFPTESKYQADQGGDDAFVAKLSASGAGLVFSSYLGGDSYDYGYGIAVDGVGNTCVTGFTNSTNFPTVSPYQTDQGGVDVFVTKLSASGTNLIFSSYLGGSDSDHGYGVAVDGPGNVYLTGLTFSTDFPIMSPYQTDQGDGTYDVFVTKLDVEGTDLIYSSYLGGSSGDGGRAIAVDVLGNAYVSGYTNSTDFPIQSPYQTDQSGEDAFVTKLSTVKLCCDGTTGNVNKSLSETPDLSDLSLLISYLTQTPRPSLPCATEANVNASIALNPDLSDLSLLISYLTQSPRPTLPSCP